ncbi:DUF3986 family protein [Niallia sp. XMNu-256]|uniref:DUF3986 family protein n=1 Tax=Niallia sp. XMNu-256 TaxID=3082444 RepID=UPI0030D25BBF
MYDNRYHLHIGYYENNNDVECVALKRQFEDVWDVFFDFEHYGYRIPENTLSIEGYGSRIFSIFVKEIDYDASVKKFEYWLFDQGLI